MTGNICIEGFQDVDIGHVFFDKRGCQFAGFTFGRKVHVLVWIQKRKKFILKLYCERFRVKGGILVSINLLIAGERYSPEPSEKGSTVCSSGSRK